MRQDLNLKMEILPQPDSHFSPALPSLEARFVENDLTIEKVAAVLATAAPKGLLMVRDEIAGWLAGMNRFNPGGRAFWLEAYGGRPYSVDRVKAPGRIFVPRLIVAWHGGIQPARLAKLLEGAEDGFLARFLWFWPDPVEFKRPTISFHKEIAVSAFERLSLLGLHSEQFGRHEPIIVPLSNAAASRLEAFSRQAQSWQKGTTGLMASALAKARGLVLRLSLVLCYLRWCIEDGMAPAPSVVDDLSVLHAIRLVEDYFLLTARRVYGDGVVSRERRRMQTLARWISTTGYREVHVRHLQRHVRLPGLVTATQIHSTCLALIEAGWLEAPARGGNKGRARQAYKVRGQIRRF